MTGPQPSSIGGQFLSDTIKEVLRNGPMTRRDLFAKVADHIPPARALRAQEKNALARHRRLLRDRYGYLPEGWYFDYQPQLRSLDARIETGRRLLFRRSWNDMCRYGSGIEYVVDGVQYARLTDKQDD